jgi:hypothetical protein
MSADNQGDQEIPLPTDQQANQSRSEGNHRNKLFSDISILIILQIECQDLFNESKKSMLL